jgi:hypothetical protein
MSSNNLGHQIALRFARKMQQQAISRARAQGHKYIQQNRRMLLSTKKSSIAYRKISIDLPEFTYTRNEFGTVINGCTNYHSKDGTPFVIVRPNTSLTDGFYFKFHAGPSEKPLKFNLFSRSLNNRQQILNPTLLLKSNYKVGSESFVTLPSNHVDPKTGNSLTMLYSNFGSYEGNIYHINSSGLGMFVNEGMKKCMIARPNHLDKRGKAVFLGSSSVINKSLLVFKVNLPFDKKMRYMSFSIPPNVTNSNVFAAYPNIKDDAGQPLVMLRLEGKQSEDFPHMAAFFENLQKNNAKNRRF